MDELYFKTDNKESLLKGLGIPEDFTGIYESPNNWVLVWIGKLPKETEEIIDKDGVTHEVVTKWQNGEFFNIYLKGQNNMDFFTQDLANAELLKEPLTPNHKLYSDAGDSN